MDEFDSHMKEQYKQKKNKYMALKELYDLDDEHTYKLIIKYKKGQVCGGMLGVLTLHP